MPKRTTSYHAGLIERLKDNPVGAVHHLNASIVDSTGAFLRALRDVAEAQQMTLVASDAGVARESLYRMLSDSGNPTLSNLVGVLRALGLALRVDVLSTDYDEHPQPSAAAGDAYGAWNLAAVKQERQHRMRPSNRRQRVTGEILAIDESQYRSHVAA